MNTTKTIPIVMSGGGADPVAAGTIQSLSRPGGNVTGLTNIMGELSGKRLELLKEVVPISKARGGSLRANESAKRNGSERNAATVSAWAGLVTSPWE
jgi:putative ABC transport system substrate-binding protein